MRALLAVDGGGTRCRMLFAEGASRAEVTLGGCNLSSDFASGINVLTEGLSALEAQLGRPLAQVPAYCALAGVVDDSIARRAEAALPLARVRVEEDRRAALWGALGPRGDGMILHAGTGSFVGLRREGQARFAGGWGARLGDEGSGYAVGRAALRTALAVGEGRAPEGPLSRRITREIGPPAQVIAFAQARAPHEIAALAEWVTEAQESDPAARAILTEAAGALTGTAREIGARPGMALCLTGGLGPALGAFLPEAFRPGLTPAAGRPLDGALRLAADFAESLA
ncbi:glucosamine kinase nucleotide-binding domain-containing protein [Roseivivax sp.]